jgi:hypothetical protein
MIMLAIQPMIPPTMSQMMMFMETLLENVISWKAPVLGTGLL